MVDTIFSKKSKQNQLTYFDPYGLTVSSLRIKKCLKKTLLKHKAVLYINRNNYQHRFSTICGPIVSYVALLRARGFSLTDIQKKKITKELLFNARIIPEFVSYFLHPKNKKIERFSIDFL